MKTRLALRRKHVASPSISWRSHSSHKGSASPARNVAHGAAWRRLLSRAHTVALLAALALVMPAWPVHAPTVPASGVPAPTVRVAAAADLQFALQELALQFEKTAHTHIAVSYGSSGNFYAQLQNGAPFDLFFSADMEYAKRLDAAGLAEPGTLSKYALGKLVLWTPADAAVDITRDGWRALLDPRVAKIAIANPEHAPYGRAAVAALHSAGIYDQVKSKLVYGENISQAAQFVQSGNAQAGLVALSLALAPAMKDGKRWEVPAGAYPPIEQGAIVMKSASDKAAARAFLDFVLSPAGRDTLRKYGFSFPTEVAAAK
jgi:molybdate transport system substrate-binding protein